MNNLPLSSPHFSFPDLQFSPCKSELKCCRCARRSSPAEIRTFPLIMRLTDAIHSPPRPGQVLLQRRHLPKYLDWLEEEGGPQRRLRSPGSAAAVERKARRGAHTRTHTHSPHQHHTHACRRCHSPGGGTLSSLLRGLIGA